MITRLNARRLLKPLLSATAVLALAGPAFGQALATRTWTGAGADGNWGTSANWSTLPVSGNVKLVFAGTAQTTANNNLSPNPFILKQIYTDSTATNGFTLTGNPVQFGSTGTGIAEIRGASSKRLTINNDLVVNVPLTVTLNTNDPNGAEVVLNGALSGSGSITSAPGQDTATVVVYTSKNNLNFTGTYTVSGTSVALLGGVNCLFRDTGVTLSASGNSGMVAGTLGTAGAGFSDIGYNQQIGSINGLGQFTLGTSGAASAGSTVLAGFLDFDDAGTVDTLNGSGSLSATNTASHFGKVGIGTLDYQSSTDSYDGSLSVRSGVFYVNSATGTLNGNVSNVFGIYGGATLRLDNATVATNAAGRLNNKAIIQNAGGLLRFDGSFSASATNVEIVDSLRLYAGRSLVVVNANVAQFAAINFAGVVNNAFDATTVARGGQVGFAGPNLGLNTAAGSSGVNFGVAGAGISAQTVGGILPFALVDGGYVTNPTGTSVTFNPTTFATVGANGIAPLTTFDGNNVLATSAVVLTSTINSLIIDAGGAPSANGTAVTSGAILSRIAGGSIGGSGLSTVGRLYLSTSNAATLSVAAPISAGGVSISGSVTTSNLALTGATPLYTVNSGTGTLLSKATGTGVVYQVSPGATIAVPAGFTVASGETLRGGGNVTGSVTIQSGGLIGGSSLAGDNGAGQAPGTLAISGALTFTTGGNYRFYISSVHGDTGGSTTNGRWTQAKITAASLDVSAAPVGSIVIQPWGLDLKNSAGMGTIYDFDNTKTYNWVLGTFSGGITGTADKFTVNTAFTGGQAQSFAQANPLGAGSFSVQIQGNDLVLNFNPVPEPALLGLAAAGLVVALRRRKA